MGRGVEGEGWGWVSETQIPGPSTVLLKLSGDKPEIRPLTKNHNISMTYVNKYVGHKSVGWLDIS